MTDDKDKFARLVQHIEPDDTGRDDLTGGLGYVLLAAVIVSSLVAWALWAWMW